MARLKSPPTKCSSDDEKPRKTGTIRRIFSWKSHALGTSSPPTPSMPYLQRNSVLEPGFRQVGILPERTIVQDHESGETSIEGSQDMMEEELEHSIETAQGRSESHNEDNGGNDVKRVQRFHTGENATGKRPRSENTDNIQNQPHHEVAELEAPPLSPLTFTTASEPLPVEYACCQPHARMMRCKRSLGPFEVKISAATSPLLQDLAIPNVIVLGASALIGPKTLLLVCWKAGLLLWVYDMAREYWHWNDDRSLDMVLAPVMKGGDVGRAALVRVLASIVNAVLDVKAEMEKNRA